MKTINNLKVIEMYLDEYIEKEGPITISFTGDAFRYRFWEEDPYKRKDFKEKEGTIMVHIKYIPRLYKKEEISNRAKSMWK